MKPLTRLVLAALGALFLLAASAVAQAPATSSVDAGFKRFWDAPNPQAAAKAADDVVRGGVSFDEALRRLKAGRSYAKTVSTGVVRLTNRTKDGLEHHYVLNVPEGYDPSRKYQVRFQLHGGVMGRTDNKPRGNGTIGSLAGSGVEQIYVIPYAWDEAPWWRPGR